MPAPRIKSSASFQSGCPPQRNESKKCKEIENVSHVGGSALEHMLTSPTARQVSPRIPFKTFATFGDTSGNAHLGTFSSARFDWFKTESINGFPSLGGLKDSQSIISVLKQYLCDGWSNQRLELTLSVACVCYVCFFLVVESQQGECKVSPWRVPDRVSAIIDVAFGFLFTMDWAVKAIALGCVLTNDIWLNFDGATAAASLVVGILESITITPQFSNLSLSNTFCSLSRFIRVLRVAGISSRIRDSTKYISHLKRSYGPPLESHAEKIVDILQETALNIRLDYHTRSELLWAAETINSRGLYEPNLHLVTGHTNVTSFEAAEGWIESALTFRGPNTRPLSSYPDAVRDFRDKANSGNLTIRSPRKMGVKINQSIHFGSEPTKEQFELADKFFPIHTLGEGISCLLEKLTEWDFPLLQLDEVTDGNSLTVVGNACFTYLGLTEALKYDPMKLNRYIHRIQLGYPAKNPYHNHRHAADVLQTVFWFLTTGGLCEIANFPIPDQLSLLLAAVIHDYDHPALNNMYMKLTNHSLAIRYNDTSILENHHCAAAFEVMQDETFDFFSGLADDLYRSCRQTIINAVLATDISCHFSEIGRFKARQKSPEFLKDNAEDNRLLLNICLHASDISNCAKPLPSANYWAGLVMVEFFAQGEQERLAGLEVSKFYDKSTTNIAKCQIGFIGVLVHPLFEAIQLTLPNVAQCLHHLENTIEFWDENIEFMEEEMRQGTQRNPVTHQPCSDSTSSSFAAGKGDKKRYQQQSSIRKRHQTCAMSSPTKISRSVNSSGDVSASSQLDSNLYDAPLASLSETIPVIYGEVRSVTHHQCQQQSSNTSSDDHDENDSLTDESDDNCDDADDDVFDIESKVRPPRAQSMSSKLDPGESFTSAFSRRFSDKRTFLVTNDNFFRASLPLSSNYHSPVSDTRICSVQSTPNIRSSHVRGEFSRNELVTRNRVSVDSIGTELGTGRFGSYESRKSWTSGHSNGNDSVNCSTK